mgnify:CR=1 FL=1
MYKILLAYVLALAPVSLQGDSSEQSGQPLADPAVKALISDLGPVSYTHLTLPTIQL